MPKIGHLGREATHKLSRLIDESLIILRKQYAWESYVEYGQIRVGSNHIDYFFRIEGLLGIQEGLRRGQSLLEALETGKKQAKYAVTIWNSRTEWQLQRYENTTDTYLRGWLETAKRQL